MNDRFHYNVTGPRIVAALIDLVPLTILFVVMAATVGQLDSTDGSGFSANLGGRPALLYLLLVMVYYIWFEGLTGASLGKKIMGLKVVRVSGEPYGWGPCFGRNLVRVLDGLPVLYMVGLISVAVTQNNQRLGDIFSDTLVVRA